MAMSYQTNWNDDTCPYLDYDTVPLSFSPPEPDLIDVELLLDPTLIDYPLLDMTPTPQEYHYTYPSLELPEHRHHQYCSYPCSCYYTYSVSNDSQVADKGTQFKGNGNKEFCEEYVGISNYCATPTYPEWNGQSEVSNETVFAYLEWNIQSEVSNKTIISYPEWNKQSEVSNKIVLEDAKGKWVEELPSIQEVELLPEFQGEVAAVFSTGRSGGGGGGGVSRQSVAARRRRRKITEKTRELGKLVPGGHKMNTAEMFGAAYKYIKFLQAQVGILHSIASTQEISEEESILQSEELHELASSKKVQEKMYSYEKCLVPKQFAEDIFKHLEIKESDSLFLNEIRQLKQTKG